MVNLLSIQYTYFENSRFIFYWLKTKQKVPSVFQLILGKKKSLRIKGPLIITTSDSLTQRLTRTPHIYHS